MNKHISTACFLFSMTFWLIAGAYNVHTIENNRFSPPETDDSYNLLLRANISKDLHNAYTSNALVALRDQITDPPKNNKSDAARLREIYHLRIFNQYNLAWNMIYNFLLGNTNNQYDIEHTYYSIWYVGLFIFGLGIFCFVATLTSPLVAVVFMPLISCTTPINYGFFWMSPQNFCIGVCLLYYAILLYRNKYLLYLTPLIAVFACFLHHSGLVLLAPAVIVLHYSCRSAFSVTWNSLNIHKCDIITILNICVFVAFIYIKLIAQYQYFDELVFPYSITFKDKIDLVIKSLQRFSFDFFKFINNFYYIHSSCPWKSSGKFALLLIFISFVWSAFLFRKDTRKLLMILSVFSVVSISLFYHPLLDPHTPVDRFFNVWVIVLLPVFVHTVFSFIYKAWLKSRQPYVSYILFSIFSCILIVHIISWQIPRWNAHRNIVIKKHAQFYYDSNKISSFMSQVKNNGAIGYAYETDAYVSLLYGGLDVPANILDIPKDDDLNNSLPYDQINLVIASNFLARVCDDRQQTIISHDFQQKRYEILFDNPLQHTVEAIIATDHSTVVFSIPPRIKHHRVTLHLDKPVKNLRFFTKSDFFILRGFLLHPDQKTFWPWGADFVLSPSRPNKHMRDFVKSTQGSYLEFGPDVQTWRVLDDTTGLIFFARN